MIVVERLTDMDHDGQPLCRYSTALARMQALIARPADHEDVMIVVQHPPTITVGRRGGHEHIHGTTLALPGHEPMQVEVFEVARGGSVTYHAPGQLVVYPVIQLPRLSGAPQRLPYGDLPGFVRLLEKALMECCAGFGLATMTRRGFAGLWADDSHKLASIGVGVRGGWSFHGLALNIGTRLEGFDLITACALPGVKMTSMWQQLERLSKPLPTFAEVEADLLCRLQSVLANEGDNQDISSRA